MKLANQTTPMIPNYPGFSGPGWSEKCNAWVKENIPAEYQGSLNSEAMIAWNRGGGRPSDSYADAIDRFTRQFNAGIAPTFPGMEWNRKFIERQKLLRG